MSEIRVDKIQPAVSSIIFTGITTFSGTGSVTLSGGTLEQRPSIPIEGLIRLREGDLTNTIEYYDGNYWVKV